MSSLSLMGSAHVPAGTRIYAIGDIHGRLDVLGRLLELIEQDDIGRGPARGIIIFLGDYVDRGPDSKGVVDWLINLQRRRDLLSRDGSEHAPLRFDLLFLKGNHEKLLLSFLDNPASGRSWLQIGGDATLVSYGLEDDVVEEALRQGQPGLIKASAMFRTLLPDDHLEFYEKLELFYRTGDYFFVHAGVKPGAGLDRQREEDMLWIRDKFLNWPDDFGAVVVHGHTPVLKPENLHNRIGIDTYAFLTGKLTAVGLEGSQRWFLST
jgi:serine/threonine protein phosphatase 1